MLMVKAVIAAALVVMITGGGQPPVSKASQPPSATKYDLLLRGGHLIDARNGISAVRDIAFSGGKVAAVAERIDPAEAAKSVDVAGLYVTPGLIDIHAHVYTGTGEPGCTPGTTVSIPTGSASASA